MTTNNSGSAFYFCPYIPINFISDIYVKDENNERTWHSRGGFVKDGPRIKYLIKTYSNANIRVSPLDAYISSITISFVDDADEAEFILKESL